MLVYVLAYPPLASSPLLRLACTNFANFDSGFLTTEQEMPLYLWGLAPRYTLYSNLLINRREKRLRRSNLVRHYARQHYSRRQVILAFGTPGVDLLPIFGLRTPDRCQYQ